MATMRETMGRFCRGLDAAKVSGCCGKTIRAGRWSPRHSENQRKRTGENT